MGVVDAAPAPHLRGGTYFEKYGPTPPPETRVERPKREGGWVLLSAACSSARKTKEWQDFRAENCFRLTGQQPLAPAAPTPRPLLAAPSQQQRHSQKQHFCSAHCDRSQNLTSDLLSCLQRLTQLRACLEAHTTRCSERWDPRAQKRSHGRGRPRLGEFRV